MQLDAVQLVPDTPEMEKSTTRENLDNNRLNTIQKHFFTLQFVIAFCVALG